MVRSIEEIRAEQLNSIKYKEFARIIDKWKAEGGSGFNDEKLENLKADFLHAEVILVEAREAREEKENKDKKREELLKKNKEIIKSLNPEVPLLIENNQSEETTSDSNRIIEKYKLNKWWTLFIISLAITVCLLIWKICKFISDKFSQILLKIKKKFQR